MFAWWGRTVYRYRFVVIGVLVALCLVGGIFGLSLGKHVTQSGFYDDSSQSVKAAVLADQVYGRDRTGHIVAILPAPNGKTIDDPAWSKKMVDELNTFKKDHSDQVMGWAGYLRAPDSKNPVVQGMKTADKKYTFVSIPLKGNNDDTILDNYKAIAPDLQKLDNGKVELAGLEPVANALTGTIAKDQHRMEVLALPLVAVVLFLVFGGVLAACLPVVVGGLSIAGALGILRLLAIFGPVHFFAQPVVTLIGLGIAVDYGLLVVSRFREEIAEGYDTEAAVRRTVMTAGRTVAFSAVLIIASGASLLMLPQGFVKSLTYALIAAVTLAALLSITLLPAVLGILGHHVDALGVRTLFRVPFLRNWKVSRAYLNWLADLLQKTKTREEVEQEFWGKLVNRVMKRPMLFAIPIVIAMILLVIPLGQLKLGGMSEKYLPPDNSVRQAQEHFDKLFPGYRTEPLTLVIASKDHKPVTDKQVADVRNKAMAISGFTEPDNNPADMWKKRPYAEDASKDPSVRVIQNGLVNRNDAPKKIADLRAITPPKGLSIMVGGTPALEQDSIHSLFAKFPLMLVVLLTTTTLLMFLAFGSVVLPIKAAVMNALTLGSTMGILTWIFVDGHFSKWLNFTATPLTAPVIALVVAVGYGLATDYEVFLLSRMVEARERGMSTAEAIRIGTATTGRIITAAALVLAVVAGSFVFSDLVMMKYLAFGLMAALLLDATVIRMFLVPSVMKLLGDDCWWAPRWMKRMQTRLGLGEIDLPDERKRLSVRGRDRPLVTARAPAPADRKPPPPHEPTHPRPDGSPRPRTAPRSEDRPRPQDTPSDAGTVRMPTGAKEPTEAPTRRMSVANRPAGGPARGTSGGSAVGGDSARHSRGNTEKPPGGNTERPSGGNTERPSGGHASRGDASAAGDLPVGPSQDRSAGPSAGAGGPAGNADGPGGSNAGRPAGGPAAAKANPHGRQTLQSTQQVQDRGIESWISELRGGPRRNDRPADLHRADMAAPRPSGNPPPADQPRPNPAPPDPSSPDPASPDPASPDPASEAESADAAEPTTALPVPPPGADDTEAAAEKLNAHAKSINNSAENTHQRRDGGLSAQDLLRREGWF